jgi:hypothetical protein
MTTAIDPTIRIMPAPSPGIYRGVPMHVYHAWDAVSNTRLSHLRRSPAHLQAYIAEPPADTVSQVVGRAAHTAILEPEQFADIFCVAEQCTATKKRRRPVHERGHAIPSRPWLALRHRGAL